MDSENNTPLKHINSSVRLDDSIPGIGYTLRHRNAVELLTIYHCKRAIGKKDGNGQVFTREDYRIMCNRAKCHDMDKIVCGLSYPQLTVDYFHRLFTGHHIENIMESANKYDLIESIMDIESARYTKPDKGLSPYEVFNPSTGFKGFMWNLVAPYLTLFGMTKPDRSVIPSIFEKCKQPVYEVDLVNAIVNYMHTTNIHRLPGISRLDDEACHAAGIIPPYRHILHSKGNLKKVLPNKTMLELGGWTVKRNMIEGTLSAQVFDLDAICRIPANRIDKINNTMKEIYYKLIKMRLHR